MCRYPSPTETIALGEVGVSGTGTDLAIVTFANGNYLSHQALPRLEAAGIKTRIVDLRWLAPLPEAALLAAVQGCEHILIVDETRRSGGVAEALMALFAEQTAVPAARLTATDSFIATGPAYGATMPSADSIFQAALALIGGKA